jgi:hypothetical protein
MTDVPLIDLLSVRELTPAVVQEHLDEIAEECPPGNSIPMALVDVISRMTAAGMKADEIAERLAGVQWAPGHPLEVKTVRHCRQIAAGSKRVPKQRVLA